MEIRHASKEGALMGPEKMAENMWSLANGITAFAILQTLAFLYALGREEFVAAITSIAAQVIIIGATVVFTIAYCLAVVKCHALVAALDSHREIWSAVTTGRIVCIIAFNLMVLCVDLATAKARGMW
jgi:hypothetical protein